MTVPTPTTSTRSLANSLKAALPWLLLAAFLLLVEYWLGWKSVLQPWLSLGWQQLLLALALLLLSYGLRTWRLYDYFPELKGRAVATLRLSLLHNLFNNLLPARTGELSFPMLMKRYFKLDYARSMSSLLWFRFLDLHTILVFALYPLLVVSPVRRLAIPMLLLWMLLPPMVYLLRHRAERWLVGKNGKLNALAQQTLHGLPDTSWTFWKSWGLTWLNWLVKLATLAWLLGQFVDGVSSNMLVTAVVAGELTSVLPFHAPAGFGTYEAGIVASLLAFIPAELAGRAAINVHLFVLGSALLGGLVAWLLPSKQTNPTPPNPTP